nr:PREDICTED: uncharacterized protein LOC107077396 [Lepisosteus oculatus]XP_015203001.1 PREDICTED: uncharacterized protein LOC107077396 [Lepisosteus oculatus]
MSAIMCLSLGLLLLCLWGSAFCKQFRADINMAGVKGWVNFDSSQKTASVNLTGACNQVNLSLNEFPVMYGHFIYPCLQTNIGSSIYRFSVNQLSMSVSVPDLFENRSSLDDLSLLVEACNSRKACATVKQNKIVKTWQAKFYSSVAGDLYIRQNEAESAAQILSDLVSLHSGAAVTSVSMFIAQANFSGCAILLSQPDPSTLSLLGRLRVGSPLQPIKSRLEIANLTTVRFALINYGTNYACAELSVMEQKTVKAIINMKGAKGSFSFTQASPFDVTELKVNLTNLKSQVRSYHVHDFPVPQRKTSEENVCSNDNVGGHWNPFNVDAKSPTYPKDPGATHDLYEIGDLSGKHMSLENMDTFEESFTDWNLPLFGRNSIIGRSVVIHQPDSSRLLCGNIGYPGEMVMAKSVFRGPVAGTILFSQLKNSPYSDLTVFLDLFYVSSTIPASSNHNWHVHMYPISSETDFDPNVCMSTKGHFNPFNINTTDSSYVLNCKPDSPFACEVGDFSGKHQPIDLHSDAGNLNRKHLFTDTTSGMSGITSILGRSVVIHTANKTSPRLACANITAVRLPSARTGLWFGTGKAQNQVQFSQSFPLDLTIINVSLAGLGAKAGGYHVHILPIKNASTSTDPCSDQNIMGHFNPFSVKVSLSPAPGSGTQDQYEIGDISGKYGLLSNLDEIKNQYMDNNMPLSGPNSIMGRSVVIHYPNGSRMQCADILPDQASDGHWVRAKATFNSSVKGTISLTQQVYPDGSCSDTIIKVDLQASQNINVTEALWHIHVNYIQEKDDRCSGTGGHFNPFKIDTGPGYNFSCSPNNVLNCEVGDLTAKHGPVSLHLRQLFTDTNLDLTGDFTVVYRSISLSTTSGILSCANIIPDSPSEQVIFPKLDSFSRFEFRNKVASVLEVDFWRVTILPEALSVVDQGKCQNVTFFLSGDVDATKLKTIQYNDKMGKFQQSKLCLQSGNAAHLLVPGGYLLTAAILVVQSSLYLVQQ